MNIELTATEIMNLLKILFTTKTVNATILSLAIEKQLEAKLSKEKNERDRV